MTKRYDAGRPAGLGGAWGTRPSRRRLGPGQLHANAEPVERRRAGSAELRWYQGAEEPGGEGGFVEVVGQAASVVELGPATVGILTEDGSGLHGRAEEG